LEVRRPRREGARPHCRGGARGPRRLGPPAWARSAPIDRWCPHARSPGLPITLTRIRRYTGSPGARPEAAAAHRVGLVHSGGPTKIRRRSRPARRCGFDPLRPRLSRSLKRGHVVDPGALHRSRRWRARCSPQGSSEWTPTIRTGPLSAQPQPGRPNSRGAACRPARAAAHERALACQGTGCQPRPSLRTFFSCSRPGSTRYR
jgi:hypothetical protein